MSGEAVWNAMGLTCRMLTDLAIQVIVMTYAFKESGYLVLAWTHFLLAITIIYDLMQLWGIATHSADRFMYFAFAISWP